MFIFVQSSCSFEVPLCSCSVRRVCTRQPGAHWPHKSVCVECVQDRQGAHWPHKSVCVECVQDSQGGALASQVSVRRVCTRQPGGRTGLTSHDLILDFLTVLD
jgi:hypothetical protein